MGQIELQVSSFVQLIFVYSMCAYKLLSQIHSAMHPSPVCTSRYLRFEDDMTVSHKERVLIRSSSPLVHDLHHFMYFFAP